LALQREVARNQVWEFFIATYPWYGATSFILAQGFAKRRCREGKESSAGTPNTDEKSLKLLLHLIYPHVQIKKVTVSKRQPLFLFL